jgi:hypothetical protein
VVRRPRLNKVSHIWSLNYEVKLMRQRILTINRLVFYDESSDLADAHYIGAFGVRLTSLKELSMSEVS